jgi:salicylate hydroxylase
MRPKLIRAIIIGGGIGGLTASIALRNEGFSTDVFERTPEFTALGVGVILCPNAIKAFGALERGIRERIIRRGAPMSDDWIHRPHPRDDGSPAERSAARTLEQEFGAPQVAIRRSVLLDILVQAHGRRGLHAGCELVNLKDDGDTTTARFADGTRADGDVLIGADGIGSAVRRIVHGDRRADYTGWSNLRGLTPLDKVPAEIRNGAAFGDEDTRILGCPVDPGTYYWSANVRVPADTWHRADTEATRARLLERIADWSLFPRVVREGARQTLVAREHRDRPPLEGWTVGQVTLLGDAAHPMTNMWGQGAATSAEDGVILARCMSAAPGDHSTLGLYDANRVPRTTRIVLASHAYGHHRDAVEFTQWLYSYEPASVPLVPPPVSA